MTVPAAPRGWSRVRWLGPGFLWMVSAAGSGELLFTPLVVWGRYQGVERAATIRRGSRQRRRA